MKKLIVILSITLIFMITGCKETEQPILVVEEPLIIEETVTTEETSRAIDQSSYVEIETPEIAPQPSMQLMEWAQQGIANPSSELKVIEEETYVEEEEYEEEYEEYWEEEVIEEAPVEEEIAAPAEETVEVIEAETPVEESLVEEETQPTEEPLVTTETSSEYPAAQYVWDYFHSLGYNDYVVAGLLGNMMCECAYQCLDLQPTIYGDGYYGICQWSSGYGEVWGTSLEYQCEFLARTLQYEMDTYGCGYDYFCALQNEQDAAIEFAIGYERCGSGSHWTRAACATEALDYFR